MAVAKRRASIISVKKKLQAYFNVKYGLLFPLTCQIVLSKGQIHCFDDHKLAMDFINDILKKFVVLEDI